MDILENHPYSSQVHCLQPKYIPIIYKSNTKIKSVTEKRLNGTVREAKSSRAAVT
jgi:hypothetical protein